MPNLTNNPALQAGDEQRIPILRVIPMKLKFPTVAADALYNVHEDSGASADYSRGLVVGVVAGMMAVTGKAYADVIPVVADLLPDGILFDRLPEAFRADVIKLAHRARGD
jgi:hypothetical protein